MIPYLIELQDQGISVRDLSGVLARSPGFANIANGEPVFGDAARQLTRLHPRQSFNQFWSQLSLDPLAIRNKHFRHSADLAHSHLQGLTSAHDMEFGAIIAAPSNYSRNQLGVLLGVIRQLPFKAAGLVDLALLQAAGTDAEESIIIDLQLHQAVLTSFRKRNGQLAKENVVQVSASGLLALHDAWSGLITDEFIRQSRFDPQHNAESEQYVYDQLLPWIQQIQARNELLLEINNKGTVHQALVTREQLEQRARNIFNRIATELNALRNPDTALHTSAANFALPGMGLYIPGLIALDDDSTMTACVRYLEQIRRDPDKLQFVTRLSLDDSRPSAPAAAPSRMPSHVLYQHRAIPLPAGRLMFGTPPADLECARVVPIPELAGKAGVALLRSPRGVQLELHSTQPLLLNDKQAHQGQPLAAGDRLSLDGHANLLQLIVVE